MYGFEVYDESGTATVSETQRTPFLTGATHTVSGGNISLTPQVMAGSDFWFAMISYIDLDTSNPDAYRYYGNAVGVKVDKSGTIHVKTLLKQYKAHILGGAV